ncbi:MAG: UPF0147 family protein [archaeon]
MTGAEEVISAINEILEDPALQKNIKTKLEHIANTLKATTKKDVRLKADKCISELDEICNDVNIQPFVRTQLWTLIGMIETVQ